MGKQFYNLVKRWNFYLLFRIPPKHPILVRPLLLTLPFKTSFLPFVYTAVISSNIREQRASLPFANNGTNSLFQWKSKNDN